MSIWYDDTGFHPDERREPMTPAIALCYVALMSISAIAAVSMLVWIFR